MKLRALRIRLQSFSDGLHGVIHAPGLRQRPGAERMAAVDDPETKNAAKLLMAQTPNRTHSAGRRLPARRDK